MHYPPHLIVVVNLSINPSFSHWLTRYHLEELSTSLKSHNVTLTSVTIVSISMDCVVEIQNMSVLFLLIIHVLRLVIVTCVGINIT